MPRTTIVFYCDSKGQIPFLSWFERLPGRAQDKCRVRIERLASLGHELRGPEADYLGDGVYELRVKHSGLNCRVLYFFHQRTTAVLSHGFMKQQREVPRREFRMAVERKRRFGAAPTRHTHEE